MTGLSLGDRVEVPYEGTWFAGVICGIDEATGQASVQCDVDQEGVKTKAPLSCLRPVCPAIDPDKVVIQKVRLANGDSFLECPLCKKQFHNQQDESNILMHLASEHGKAYASSDGKQSGDSDQLDMLNASCTANYHPKHAESKRRMHVISLGSFCGPKFSIQRLGLGAAHLPFDWIRTTTRGLQYFLNNNFEDFFKVASRTQVKSANLTVHRSERHSFWHDDVSKADVREKLRRRIDRFVALREESKDLLFVRSAACTAEIADTEDLYSTLVSFFGAGQRRRILLVVIVTGQDKFEGPIMHTTRPGVIFFLQPVASESEMLEGRAFSLAVTAAVETALAVQEGSDPSVGFGEPLGCRTVSSAVALFEGQSPVKTSNTGLQSGYEGLMCFEQPNVAHVDLCVAGEDVVLPSAIQ
mmetsp:Transcript_22362/g.35459  ORF Transcript_22362/g.35459 Transcript_22362/m.35459 type:complete len:413 (+) Transcript_22362:75-1313(+)